MRLAPFAKLAALILLALAAGRPAGAADAPPADGPGKPIAGTYAVVAMSMNGQPAPPDAIKGLAAVITPATFTIKDADRSEPADILALDASKSPATIDARSATKKDLPAKLGIYKADGDTLTFCFAKPGTPRPTDFKPGAGRSTVELKRTAAKP